MRPAAWVLGPVLLGTVLLRLHRLGVPLERDEGEYAYVAQLLLEGVPPFARAYSMKMPGIYYAYAAALGVGGERIETIHAALLAANLLAALGLFLLGRRWIGPMGGALAAAVWCVLSLLPSVLGIVAHATQFVAAAALTGLALLARGLETRRIAEIFAAGLLLGIGFSMKQHGAAFILFGVLLVCLEGWRAGDSRRRIAGFASTLAAGALLPVAAITLHLALAGVFDRFWFWTFEYASRYASITASGEALGYLRNSLLPLLLGGGAPLWVLAAIGVFVVARDSGYRRRRTVLLVFAACSAAAVLPGFYFRPHYFVLLLPAASLFAAVGMLAAGARLRVPAVGIFVLAAAVAVVTHRQHLLTDPPDRVSHAVYVDEFFPETRRIGDVLRARSMPGDTLAVLGSEPQIYFYADRRSATGYLYTYPLMEPQPFARRMQEEMIAEIEGGDPRFLVFVNQPNSWGRRADSDLFILRWLQRALRRYRRIGLIELRPNGESTEHWDAAARRPPRTDAFCLVYERRTRGVPAP